MKGFKIMSSDSAEWIITLQRIICLTIVGGIEYEMIGVHDTGYVGPEIIDRQLNL